jgi:molybdate transport system substrate-binding protein
MRLFWALASAVPLLTSCGKGVLVAPGPAKVTIAAAANLTDVFGEVGPKFTEKTGIAATFSFGSTAQLAQQIENGAPFDLFAAADVEHVDSLIAAKKLTAPSRAVYALGQVALWIPKGEEAGVHELKDLAKPGVHFIAIAQPNVAPYGQASVDALKKADLWTQLQPKVVYGGNISQAKQLASSGNADAAFTAYSLVKDEKGVVLKVDPSLYKPIEQALGIVAGATHSAEAERFRSFLLGADGRDILQRRGYQLP